MIQPEIIDSRALRVDIVRVGLNNTTLISCDHRPSRMPKEDPWPDSVTIMFYGSY